MPLSCQKHETVYCTFDQWDCAPLPGATIRIHTDESIGHVSQGQSRREVLSEVRRRCLICQSEWLYKMLVMPGTGHLDGKHKKPKGAM